MLKIPENRYVCGWLVCVEGINKGMSYPIHQGKNFIGGGDGMDIQILGDNKVDQYRHAIVAFDDKTLKTMLLPGESRGLVYLNDMAVYTPTILEDYAQIDVGDSKLKFVPFCGDKHQWGTSE
ncbi:MAG: FHA domain-containing protein [Firmicutes bacterium]|nr:FHA domain-containing protein [Bacillota bacterium]